MKNSCSLSQSNNKRFQSKYTIDHLKGKQLKISYQRQFNILSKTYPLNREKSQVQILHQLTFIFLAYQFFCIFKKFNLIGG